jgi:hypothetical protein
MLGKKDMTSSFKYITILSLCFFNIGCFKTYYSLNHCFKIYDDSRKCSIPAKFETMEKCRNYSILYTSNINYDELKTKGTTIATYLPNSAMGERAQEEIYCEKD